MWNIWPNVLLDQSPFVSNENFLHDILWIFVDDKNQFSNGFIAFFDVVFKVFFLSTSTHRFLCKSASSSNPHPRFLHPEEVIAHRKMVENGGAKARWPAKQVARARLEKLGYLFHRGRFSFVSREKRGGVGIASR